MEIDPDGIMWVVDVGRKYFTETADNTCPPKIILLEVATGKELSRYTFPNDVAPYDASFLNDIVLDFPRKIAYLSSAGNGPADKGAIIVYDHANKASRRFEDDTTYADSSAQITIHGADLKGKLTTPTDGIALAPSRDRLYYSPLDGFGLFSVPTAILRDFSSTNAAVSKAVTKEGAKPSNPDGMTFGANGNMFFGGVTTDTLYEWTPKTKTSDAKPIFHDPKRLWWIDTFAWDNVGNLWMTTNKLNLWFFGEKNSTHPHGQDISGKSGANMRLIKVPVGTTSYMDVAPEPSPTPPPTPTPTPTPSPTPSPGGWNLSPIHVRGNKLYDETGKQFRGKGIGFPNVGKNADVKDWIAVLRRIHKLSTEINLIRIYEPPSCSVVFGNTCFESFMREADSLGIYVIIAGSGTDWGYFPGLKNSCKDPMDCYKKGGVLGFGRQVVLNFNFPNVFAIVLANEVEQNIPAMPALKAYARDMKLQMKLCNENKDSPTKGKMRQIPLMYAATDTGPSFVNEADYLFCGGADVSLDIFGLNIERWISDEGGRSEYKKVNAQVIAKQWPGAFVHSEEGGPYSKTGHPYPKYRTWNQMKGFFEHYPAISGFAAYAYFGAKQFNMFDGISADAKIFKDGEQFFKRIKEIGPDPAHEPFAFGRSPECNSTLTVRNVVYPMADFAQAKIYATGPNSYAINCPKPWQVAEATEAMV